MIHRKFTVGLAAALIFTLADFARSKDQEQRVEIKYLVPEGDIVAVSQSLGIDPDHPTETRVICFYDTDSLALFKRTPKVILRSRYESGSGAARGETTVKVRGEEIAATGVKCEWDEVIGKEKLKSCSLTDETQSVEEIQAANEGGAVKKIFTVAQGAFLKTAKIEMDGANLVPFGPVEGVKVWKEVPAAGLKKVTVERWELPAHAGKPAQILFEVSTKVPLSEEPQAVEALKKNLHIQNDQKLEEETKTRIVLEHFSSSSSGPP